MTAPTLRPSLSDAREWLKEALAEAMWIRRYQRLPNASWQDALQIARGVPDGKAAEQVAAMREEADALIAGPLAPLLDELAAGRTRAEVAARPGFGLRQFARAEAATADRDRLAERVKVLAKESAFLLARLADFENGGVTDDNARDWFGHVRPSMARLAALASTEGGTDVDAP